jgi:hypothetical protein
MPLGKIVTPLYSHGRTSRKYSTKLTEIAGTIIFIVFLIQTFATTKQYGMLMSGTTVVKQVDYEPIHDLQKRYDIKPSGFIGFNASRTRLLIQPAKYPLPNGPADFCEKFNNANSLADNGDDKMAYIRFAAYWLDKSGEQYYVPFQYKMECKVTLSPTVDQHKVATIGPPNSVARMYDYMIHP